MRLILPITRSAYAVLPGRGRRRQYFAQANRFDLPTEERAEHSIPITNKVFRHVPQAGSLIDLPRRPSHRRALGRVRVEDFPPIVTEHDQNKQDTEGRRSYREKIGGDNLLGVVLKKSTPSL